MALTVSDPSVQTFSFKMTTRGAIDEQPQLPGLIVEYDGSVGAVSCLSDWTDDVDQWFWSSSEAYLVDSQGRRFDQVGERDSSGRPMSIPNWTHTRILSGDELVALTKRDFPNLAGTFRERVDAIVQVELA